MEATACVPGDGLSDADADALRQALLGMRLIDEDEHPRLMPLAGGISSLIVLAHTRRGAICVKRALERLKVAADWKAPVERNRVEVQWMRTAAALVPDAVPPIVGHDERYGAFAMHYLAPDEYPVWKSMLARGEADVSTAAAVAKHLASIHSATARVPAIAAGFANEAIFHALRLDPYFGETARRNPECAKSLHALMRTTESSRIALVHGDVSPKNILVGSCGPVFLDAECATFGDPAFDLSFCLNHLLLKALWIRPARARLRACFDAMRHEYIGRVTWETADAFESRAAALLAGLMLARIDGKSPVEYLDQRDRARVRDFARPFVLNPPARLDDIVVAWDRGFGT